MGTQLGRPTVTIVLTAAERESLERWARRPSTAQGIVMPSREPISLHTGRPCGSGWFSSEIAQDPTAFCDRRTSVPMFVSEW